MVEGSSRVHRHRPFAAGSLCGFFVTSRGISRNTIINEKVPSLPPRPRAKVRRFEPEPSGSWARVGRRERAFACATRTPRDTPALGDHGLRTALGCRCRGADCATLSSIIPTATQVRGAGASEPDNNMVHALVGGRGPAAARRHRGCGSETRVRARCLAGVLPCLTLPM